MLSRTLLRYGSNLPLPEPVPLRAGPLTMQFEPLTGWLRYIRIGDHEIVRAIYAAVRDENWGTVPAQLTNLAPEIARDSFRLSFDVHCRQPAIDYFWRGTVVGEADGTVRYSFDGEARSEFRRNRIGICVLHPIIECAGQPCTVEHSDGKLETGVFPRHISAIEPFHDVRKISYGISGVMATLTFDGDQFEMEDQRNWSDASFKTYCTPQSEPKPASIHVGDTVQQSVALTLQQPVRPVLPVLLGRAPQFSISTTPVIPLPPIGFCLERTGRSLTPMEIERLRLLRPAHLRVDLRLAENYTTLLEAGAIQSRALDTALHIGLILSANAAEQLKRFRKSLQELKPRVGLWLVFHESEESAGERWIILARQLLQDYGPAVLFAGGTLDFFTELNRSRPAADSTAFPCFSLNPQVHAFDNATMVENLAGQAMDLESTRTFCAKPVVVSPITLKIRSGNASTTAMPPDVDPRQMSLFGAGWTLGSIARLASTGHAHSLTYFETVGWRGLMEAEAGSAAPEQFPSIPGSVFPMYHVFADIADGAWNRIYPTHSSHPLIAEGLTLADPHGRRRVLLANFSSHPQEVKIKTGTCQASIRYLDATNAERAMTEPENFRRETGEVCDSVAGKIPVKLLPYGLARVDLS